MKAELTIWNGCESVNAVFQNEYEAIEVFKRLQAAIKAGKDRDWVELELRIRETCKDVEG